MGMIGRALDLVFGGGVEGIRQTAEVFRENAENRAVRDQERMAQALAQYGAEFRATRGNFDQVMDGLNRLPRPMLAFGSIGLFWAAMVDPLWFAERMQGLALVPEPLWWLMGAVVSFYFGARHQLKGQEFQRDIARSLARVPVVIETTRALRDAEGDRTDENRNDEDRTDQDRGAEIGGNAALEDWRASRGGNGGMRP